MVRSGRVTHQPIPADTEPDRQGGDPNASKQGTTKLVLVPAFYHRSVSDFSIDQDDLIVGRLANITRHGISKVSAEQIEAWHRQLPILRSALSRSSAQSWHLLLEFPIPRRGKRIDAVILTNRVDFGLRLWTSGFGLRTSGLRGQSAINDFINDFGDSPLWYEVKNPVVAEKN